MELENHAADKVISMAGDGKERAGEAQEDDGDDIRVRITYYKNGFVVGEDKHSPFRAYD